MDALTCKFCLKLAAVIILLAAGWYLPAARADYSPGDPRYYNMGSPVLTELYVSPTGSDANDGASPVTPLRTLTAAWSRVPITLTTTGYRINLLPGSYPCGDNETTSCINYFENRHGSAQYPLIIRGNGGVATLRGGLDVAHVSYLYLIDLNLIGGGALPTNSSGNNLLHLTAADHVLLRNLSVVGPNCASDACNNLQEVFKVNQAQHLYVEDSDFSGAWHTVVDYFAVQYGHFVNNRLRTAGQWCMYVKGGSAYLNIEANQLVGCQLGFQAGQAANLAMMVLPWLHYEVYDLKFINNTLREIPGVGLSVAGGYNVLFAYNTLYRVGTDPIGYPLFQAVRGERNCTATDELPNPASTCQDNLNYHNGWGPNFDTRFTNPDLLAVIPNRNVYVYNNIFYNPAPAQTEYSHLNVWGPIARPANFQNIPNPILSDDNLVIAGNIIWNGPVTHPLGIEEPDRGCQPVNPTCNAAQLVVSNTINMIEPQLVAPDLGYVQPITGSNVYSTAIYPIPDFSWSDAPAGVATGTLTNTVTLDQSGQSRWPAAPPGAYLSPTAVVILSVYLPVIRK